MIRRRGWLLPSLSAALIFVRVPDAHAQTPLDTVHVTATRVPEYLEEFESRRVRGLGHYLTEAQLDSTKHERLADLIARRFTGIRAQWISGGEVSLVSTRGPISFHKPVCAPHVYIDAVFGRPDLGSFQSGDVVGVEYYSDVPPVQYKRAGSQCGVILIWTRKW